VKGPGLRAEGLRADMAELDDIYNTKLLELAAHIPLTERLSAPDASATAHSKLCGSTVSIDLKMNDNTVSDYSQTVKACLLGQATAAIIGQYVIGATAQEVREAASEMRRMLKENGPAPGGRFAELALMEPVRHYKARHGSVMLTFDALETAIAEIEQKRALGKAGATPA
jgi:NifU-like protein involved in Fe-S cluster formation